MQDKKFLPGKGDKLYRDEKYIAAVFGGKRIEGRLKSCI